MKRLNILLLVLTLVAIIFAATSIISPWWSLSLSTEARIILNSDFRVDYGLLKSVSATFASQTTNQSRIVGLENLTSQEDPNADSFRFMDTTLGLVVAGCALSTPLVIAMIIPQLNRYRKYIAIIGYLSSVILFISSFYYVSQVAGPMSQLSSLTPISTPTDWVTISPADITGAWGSKAIPTASPLLVWLRSGNFWVWQPSLGWYLAFSSALFIALASLILHLNLGLEKKQETSQEHRIPSVAKSTTSTER
jgi:hypothetical protein